MAIIAKMATTATAIINSIRVKPRLAPPVSIVLIFDSLISIFPARRTAGRLTCKEYLDLDRCHGATLSRKPCMKLTFGLPAAINLRNCEGLRVPGDGAGWSGDP